MHRSKVSQIVIAFPLFLFGSILLIAQSCEPLSSENNGILTIVRAKEPGERLIISGMVTDRKGKPIPAAKLFFYHANSEGEYNSTLLGMPSFARLRGTLHTDKNGHFKLKTIVPGNYPGETTGKHIHVVANAKGFKEWKFEFLFEGWVSQSLRKEILKNKDAIILDLKEKEGDCWTVTTRISLSTNQ